MGMGHLTCLHGGLSLLKNTILSSGMNGHQHFIVHGPLLATFFFVTALNYMQVMSFIYCSSDYVVSINVKGQWKAQRTRDSLFFFSKLHDLNGLKENETCATLKDTQHFFTIKMNSASF